MAEYIDKIQAMNIIASGKNDNAYFGTTSKDWEVIDFLKSVPTADVVEREKINKAIEELKTEKGEIAWLFDDDWDDGLELILEILKRNIGESEE